MDWKQIADRANQLIDQRGGAQSVKEDAYQLKDIIQGQGTMEDKVKRAMEALREPGADHGRAAANDAAVSPAGPGEGQSTPVQDGGEGPGENTN